MKIGDIIITKRGAIAIITAKISSYFISVITIENKYGQEDNSFMSLYIGTVVEIIEV